MSLWRRRRYYCNNTVGLCRHALADTPHYESDFRRQAGRCGGDSDQGCGNALIEGDALDLRAKRLSLGVLFVVFAAGLGWAARVVLFPPPLEHVTFAAAESSIDDRAGRVRLEVVRDSGLDRRVAVKYASTDGSAKAGADYEAVHSALTFERGERTKTIELAVLPDLTLEKQQRSFSLVLNNVRGQPQHVIHIAPRAANRDHKLQTEQAILMASRIAADIGGFMVKRRVLMDLLALGKPTAGEIAEYKQQLIDVHDNLLRAREGYAEAMRSLSTHEATLVIRSMEQLAEDLAQRNFDQQSQAIAVMKTQFTELVNERRMDLDRWARELEAIVPRAPDQEPKISA